MIEAWLVIFWFMLAVYVVLDGRNFGAGALQPIVAKSEPERRLVMQAIGHLWTWHEVWLVSAGGVLFMAFPRVLAVGFSGYYLAIFLLLWSLILRGLSIELAGHIDSRLWQSFWDFVFVMANILLAVLFGVALGNIIRGVPLDATGDFHMAFFTNFGVRGNVGLLDWYTVSLGLFSLVALAAHGATYLTLNAQDPVRERSRQLVPRLWVATCAMGIVVLIETCFVRPELFAAIAHRPFAWLGVAVTIAGAVSIFIGISRDRHRLAFRGSCAFLGGALIVPAVASFPIMLHSTLDPKYSLSAYDGGTSGSGLGLALIWWPIAVVLTVLSVIVISRGRRNAATASQGPPSGY